MLRTYVRERLIEATACADDDSGLSLLVEPDFDPERDETLDVEPTETTDEASVAGAVAGYTLPLGASGPAFDRDEFVAVSRRAFGGTGADSKPRRKKKKK